MTPLIVVVAVLVVVVIASPLMRRSHRDRLATRKYHHALDTLGHLNRPGGGSTITRTVSPTRRGGADASRSRADAASDSHRSLHAAGIHPHGLPGLDEPIDPTPSRATNGLATEGIRIIGAGSSDASPGDAGSDDVGSHETGVPSTAEPYWPDPSAPAASAAPHAEAPRRLLGAPRQPPSSPAEWSFHDEPGFDEGAAFGDASGFDDASSFEDEPGFDDEAAFDEFDREGGSGAFGADPAARRPGDSPDLVFGPDGVPTDTVLAAARRPTRIGGGFAGGGVAGGGVAGGGVGRAAGGATGSAASAPWTPSHLRRRRSRRSVVLAAAAAVVVVGGGAAGAVVITGSGGSTPSATGASQPGGSPLAHPSTRSNGEVATTTTPPPTPSTTAPPPFTLVSTSGNTSLYHLSATGPIVVRAQSPCWVDAHQTNATGPSVFTALMAPGQTETLHAPVWIRLGAPSAVTISVGGSSLPAPASHGDPFNLQLE